MEKRRPRHFVRFDMHNLEVESKTTFTGQKPQGRNWKEIFREDGEQLVNIIPPESERTLLSDVVETISNPGNFLTLIQIIIRKDGVAVLNLQDYSDQDLIAQFNASSFGVLGFASLEEVPSTVDHTQYKLVLNYVAADGYELDVTSRVE